MELSSNQVSGDQGLDFQQTEISKPLSIRQQQSYALKCPRCSSTNTKFCYYNNYNKSQPRHFCKSCKRHWTKGGTLRNVPVGGAHKIKRPRIQTTVCQQDFSSSGRQKNMSNILYHALIGRSETSKGVDNVSISGISNSTGLPQIIPDAEFQLSSSSTFDINASLNPASYFDHLAGNLDSVEKSTITTLNVLGRSGALWESSSMLDLPNYWNWKDIDVLTSESWDHQDKTMQ